MRAVRSFGLAASVAAVLLGIDVSARAQSNYPNRPLHIIVPYAACGIGYNDVERAVRIIALGPRANVDAEKHRRDAGGQAEGPDCSHSPLPSFLLQTAPCRT